MESQKCHGRQSQENEKQNGGALWADHKWSVHANPRHRDWRRKRWAVHPSNMHQYARPSPSLQSFSGVCAVACMQVSFQPLLRWKHHKILVIKKIGQN